MSQSIHKILIANRGEIACRVIRTARDMGIKTVAVFSDADRNAQHVLQADEAVYIGGSASSESYLRADKIIAAAQKTGAQAIHPGYGFLSENESFAEALADAGLIFIGPPVPAIAAMGSKSAAKNIMQDAGVPLVPGYHGDDQDPDLLASEAEKIGYPVLLKAAYGGGGKGMRVVEKAADFNEALASAKREAKAAFSNDKMLVEKYITRPRHVEIQVFCDQHGNAIYLAERDCSVQRRHQKVIEEAPAPGLDETTRKAMGEAAVRAAQAIDYVGAGTVEFLFDEDQSFYFMEMNTRLQVEHPVTEMITGVDLVEWQIRVAAGEVLPMQQNELVLDGHAFEARIYAENADDNFMPSTGKVAFLRHPEASPYCRWDSGIVAGDEVTTFYDPMIAKLIVWDEDRDSALRRLANALRDTRIAGVTTNTDYLHRIATHPAFVKAELTTRFIEQYGDDLQQTDFNLSTEQALLVLAAYRIHQQQQATTSSDPWAVANGWRMNATAKHHLVFTPKGTDSPIVLDLQQHGDLFMWPRHDLKVAFSADGAVLLDDQRMPVDVAEVDGVYTLFTASGRFQATLFDELAELAHEEEAGSLTAPMNGTIVAVNVAAGDTVAEGQALVVMEAMKMEYTIRAPFNGTVEQIFFHAGELVSDGAELISLAAENE
ncbi:MAG: acetyl/propionyl/methylcrotonyl-CoA carboxylase subunit alpha [Aliidiomarina sp.]|uniref:acetyl/propionyl/methylcrotonyl-CoA carboxylase subunit alpha n=1 Tax=Aliidiomarina sp. TaxID=1872439 RepID=UPI0025BF6B5A|nr:acetyl/propionyl/methylcrotonyl-CoA carboxylase subunit alpha [Aliidiomarina sp.]MCH8502051.1 acetyl/propionyl/methylcrotonyl-CoA carboxylase subunit alpha [Aliidiomarina sp.]